MFSVAGAGSDPTTVSHNASRNVNIDTIGSPPPARNMATNRYEKFASTTIFDIASVSFRVIWRRSPQMVNRN